MNLSCGFLIGQSSRAAMTTGINKYVFCSFDFSRNRMYTPTLPLFIIVYYASIKPDHPPSQALGRPQTIL